ncbi:hypothetical protein D3C72_2571400 [compost metagenome]
MAPATSKATKGVCFHTKANTMPRQSRKLIVSIGVIRPRLTAALFIMPFLARKVRINCPTTMNGMNIGQR